MLTRAEQKDWIKPTAASVKRFRRRGKAAASLAQIVGRWARRTGPDGYARALDALRPLPYAIKTTPKTEAERARMQPIDNPEVPDTFDVLTFCNETRMAPDVAAVLLLAARAEDFMEGTQS